jgi:hypothetical protein
VVKRPVDGFGAGGQVRIQIKGFGGRHTVRAENAAKRAGFKREFSIKF